MRKSKILFTGAGGFLGRQFVPLLKKDGWDVTSPRSSQVNLENKDEVDKLFDGEYDFVIHAAMVGKKFAGKNVIDDKAIVNRNMHIFENIFRHINKIGVFINFDSGVSDIDPEDPYGFSKYCIAQRVLSHYKGINLKAWGCFGPYEDEERFFHTNITNYLRGRDIVIHQDKQMDFIYADDLYKILCSYLQDVNIVHPKELECVYEKNYYLSEIAEIINNLGEHKVNIIKKEEGIGDPYCGTFDGLPVKCLGMEKGIRMCYNYYMKVINRQVERTYSQHIWK